MVDQPKHFESTEEVKEIFQSEMPHIYANGFTVVLGTGDVILLLKTMGVNVATLSLSYTVAKTLSEKLGGIIKLLEIQTGNTIMTTDDVEKSLAKGKSDVKTK